LPEPASWIVLAIGTLLTVAAALRSRTLATPAASDSVGAIWYREMTSTEVQI
jgi:hypothetical protein